MKKLTAIFMAIVMVVSMFSISMVVFAEDSTEVTVTEKYLGTASSKNLGLKYDRRLGVITDDSQGGVAKPWNLHVFNPETVIEDTKISEVQPTVGTTIIDKINALAAEGPVNIVLTADAEEAVYFYGLKGTETAPIVILSNPKDVNEKTFNNNKTEEAAINLVDCEYVTVKNIAVSAKNIGVSVENSSNVTIEGLDFTQVGYTDYITPVVDEAGNESINPMDTTLLTEKGASILVGANCDGVTISECTFAKCRAGVVADNSALEEGEVASTGISVLGCTFEEMTDAAVYVDGADGIVVADGTVTKSGTLASAADYDGTAAADFVVCNAEDITIERIYSTDNNSFIYAENATGRVRYNVSDRDGYSSVDAAALLIYNNTFVAAASLDLTAVVKNNIFDMNMGEKVTVGEGEANCYHWTSKGDRGSIRKNPQFANAYDGSVEGTSVKDNYILSTESPCLGEGVKVEDDMGTTDFYGNEIGTSYNIGADAGAGAEATVKLVSQFVDSFNYIIALIRNFFANLFG